MSSDNEAANVEGDSSKEEIVTKEVVADGDQNTSSKENVVVNDLDVRVKEDSLRSDDDNDESSNLTDSVDVEAKVSEDRISSEKNPLDDLLDDELIEAVQEIQRNINYLTTENQVFETFLRQNDPPSLEDMEKIIENALKNLKTNSEEVTKIRAPEIAPNISFGGIRPSLVRFKVKGNESGSHISLDKGLKINLTQKSELVSKDIDDVQKTLTIFFKKSHRKKCILNAEVEEMITRINEINDAFAHFERSVLLEGVDPLTQRIPAEKFVRYMQEWLKTSEIALQKLRLRISTYTVHIRKLQQTLKQKRELGESLHAVDFEKLQIENKHFVKQIDRKTLQLIDLKKMNGGANLILTNQKKYLQSQLIAIKQLQRDIDETNQKIKEIVRETNVAVDELEKAKAKYESIKTMIEEYKVPDVMDYVMNGAKLNEIKKNLKIWSRRNHLQNVALNSTIREMKNITGSKKVLDVWFTPYKIVEDSGQEDDKDSEIDPDFCFSFSNFHSP